MTVPSGKILPHNAAIPALVVLMVLGVVIPTEDYDHLRRHGAAEIFGPAAVIPEAANRLFAELETPPLGIGLSLLV